MKKSTFLQILLVIAILLMFLLSKKTAAARINEDPNISRVKANQILTSDVQDLQNQIDQLVRKNGELELKMLIMPKQQTVAAQPVVTISAVDSDQTNRISAIETRLGMLEKTTIALRGAIDKTIGLLTKLLKMI